MQIFEYKLIRLNNAYMLEKKFIYFNFFLMYFIISERSSFLKLKCFNILHRGKIFNQLHVLAVEYKTLWFVTKFLLPP